MFIDKLTRQRVQRMRHTGDINYDLEGDSAISNETVPVIGDWTDYTGSAVVSTKTQMYGAGAENQLFGDDAAERIHLPNLNEVGQTAGTTRRRIIKRNVNFNGNSNTN